MRRFATIARPLTRSERENIYRWLRRVKELVRARHRVNHDDHLVRGDDDLASAIVDYSSIAYDGWTWPGEDRLAEILNECDRNIRKRLARLRTAKLLIVISPSDGWRSNRYIPVLDGRPLFEVALTSEQVRAAIAALHPDGCDTGTPVPPQDTPECGTPVPPDEANLVHVGRNARSTEPSRNNLQERDSPSPCPTPRAAPTGPRRKGEMLGPELQEANATAPPESAPTPNCRSDSTEQPTPPNGCPSGHEPEVRAQPAWAERATAPIVEFSFACLVRDYPHPRGTHGVEHRAYYPHALRVWGQLTPEQKHEGVCAAPHAPGKIWLGHWLNSGRETGKFEIVEQPAVARRVWVRKDTPQWAAWVADGRRPLTTQRRDDGQLETGWMFESEWPPGVEAVERVGGVK
jgi:hypothetical protein